MIYFIVILQFYFLIGFVDVAYIDNSPYEEQKEHDLTSKDDVAKDRTYERMWNRLAIRHGRRDMSHPSEAGVEHTEPLDKDMDRDIRVPSSDKHIRFGRADSNFLRFGRPSDNKYKLMPRNNSPFLRLRRRNSDFIRFGRGDQYLENQRFGLDGRNQDNDELTLNYEIKDRIILKLLTDMICNYNYNNCQQIEHD